MTLLYMPNVNDPELGPPLKKKARPLTAEEISSGTIKQFMSDMLETMHAARRNCLTAPQVGESIQLILVEIFTGTPRKLPAGAS
jgi:peptide deformylase